MNQNDISEKPPAVHRYSLKLPNRSEALLFFRRIDEGVSSRVASICDRFAVIFDANVDRVKENLSEKDITILQHIYAQNRQQSGWLANYLLKKTDIELQRSPTLQKFITLSATDVVIIEEIVVRSTSSVGQLSGEDMLILKEVYAQRRHQVGWLTSWLLKTDIDLYSPTLQKLKTVTAREVVIIEEILDKKWA